MAVEEMLLEASKSYFGYLSTNHWLLKNPLILKDGAALENSLISTKKKKSIIAFMK